MNKKVGLFFLFSLLFSFLSPRFVSAEQPWDTIKYILTFEFLDKLGLQPLNDPAAGFIRFLIWFLAAVLLFKLLEMLGLGKSTSFIVAPIISFISVLLIPGSILVVIATNYSLLFSLLLLALPILAVYLIYHFMKDHPWLRLIFSALLLGVTIFLAYLINNLAKTETSSFRKVLETIDSYFWLIPAAAGILFLLSIYHLFKGHGSAGSTPSSLSEEAGSPALNHLRGQEALPKREKQEERALLNELVVEEEEKKLLEKTYDQAYYDYKRTYFNVVSDLKGVPNFQFLHDMQASFEALDGLWKKVLRKDHRWKQKRRKETSRANKLINEMDKDKLNPDSIKWIENQEKIILQHFLNVENLLVSKGGAEDKWLIVKESQKEIYQAFKEIYQPPTLPKPDPDKQVTADQTSNLARGSESIKKAIAVGAEALNYFIINFRYALKEEIKASEATAVLEKWISDLKKATDKLAKGES